LENPECRNPDDTCQQPRYHCGTRRNSGLCWSFVIPSTLETPKCRIPTPWDLATPVPFLINGSRQLENRDSRFGKSQNTYLAKRRTPNPDVPILDQTPPGFSFLSGPTLPRHFGISRIANPRHKVPCCWKPRTKPRFFGFVPPVLPTIDGSHEIGKSLIATLTCMQLLHSPTPICRNMMANEFLLRLEVNSSSRVQVADSLPLEEFSCSEASLIRASSGSVPQYL
jgi:hypothetical protein